LQLLPVFKWLSSGVAFRSLSACLCHRGEAARSGLLPQKRETTRTIAEIRLLEKEHCEFVASQSRVVSAGMANEANHRRFVSDKYTVRLRRLFRRIASRQGI
jgi:hypothetical protein